MPYDILTGMTTGEIMSFRLKQYICAKHDMLCEINALNIKMLDKTLDV